MEKYKGKYRIPSARHPNWDYNKDGAYFITICTKNREHFFGECKNDKMKLSTIGAIVQGFWYDIPKHFSHAELDIFQVMPNHIHGILILNREHVDNQPIISKIEINYITDENEIEKKDKNKFFQKISPKPGSVSTILRSFKSECTKHIHKAFSHIAFEWQERFWDNIIRTDEDFIRISNYIINNPKNWKEDRFFGEGK